MKHIILSLLIFAMISVQVLARDKLALVVGNNSYAGMFDSLNNSVNDARKIAEALKDLDFKVILKLNASQETIELAINEFGDKLTKNAVGLFYFSGHAAQYKDVNYLVPTNFIQNSNKLRYRATPVGFILAEMKKANNGLNIVILDACRNILEEIQDKGYGNAGGLGKMPAISGSVIAYATQPGFKSYEDKTQDNSYYTKHLLRFIKQDGLSLTELFSEVSLAVSKETKGKQEPWTSFLSLPKFCLAGCKLDNDIDKKKLQKQLERERLEKKQLQRQLQELIGSKLGKIAKLLKTCQFRFDNNWLTSGGNGTALDCYKDVLKLDANNFAASQGLVNIENKYINWVQNAINQGKKAKASQYLASLSLLNPESPKIAELERKKREISPIDMILIPKGEYPFVGEFDGKIHKNVYVGDFLIDKYEVTNSDYQKCVDNGYCKKPPNRSEQAEGDRKPMYSVTWYESKRYCEWKGKRLPSEVEWEKAATWRNGIKYKYPNGKNTIDCTDAIFNDEKNEKVIPFLKAYYKKIADSSSFSLSNLEYVLFDDKDIFADFLWQLRRIKVLGKKHFYKFEINADSKAELKEKLANIKYNHKHIIHKLLRNILENSACGRGGIRNNWEVGSRPSEINGTYDMAGNVSEWVSDEVDGKKRMRGLSSSHLIVHDVGEYKPSFRYPSHGFRCAKTFLVPIL